ncbi:hypothetical protein [Aquimarina sp. SS2-1]|uniref:hypothetical protein n=1 Tax=Aquimarina besae TaxID=3342247 RepID=UPI00366F01DD
MGCKEDTVNGVVIGHTLLVHQTLKENRELKELILNSLNKEENAILDLKDFWCGGGAGCYDLGYIITQIIYRLGEDYFVELMSNLCEDQVKDLEFLIYAGLEYGDNNYDGKMDDKRLENEFPKLYNLLNI